MTGRALVRLAHAIVWECRGAWASGRRVAVTLERCDMARVEGHVHSVSATDATVTVAGVLIPLDRVLAVHLPSRLGDSTARGGEWRGPALRRAELPGQEELTLERTES